VREPPCAQRCIRSVPPRAALVLACLVLAGCAADATTPASTGEIAPRGSTRVVVTQDDPALPGGCRPRRVALRIGAFLAAFNRGDGSAARFAAPELGPHGGWYSVSEAGRRHFVTARQSDLARYFVGRHRRGERMRLLEVAIGFANGLGHIEFRIDRRADDLRRLGITTTIAYGKGALRCEDGRIVAWSMGMAAGRGDPHDGFEICPPPPTRVAAVIACARRWSVTPPASG
jgi:hypothetical protein